MNIYLVSRAYFTFGDLAGGEIPLCGKTVSERMQENLGAIPCDMPPAGEKLVLYPAYPFLTRKEVEAFLESHTGSVRFAGGYLDRGGAYEEAEGFEGGVFSLKDFALAQERAECETRDYFLRNGVLAEAGVQIDCRAKIAAGAFIGKGSRIIGACVIGAGAAIFGSELQDSSVGAGTTVKSSVLISASVGDNCSVGPNAYLRPDSIAGNCCRIGDFVELKNARIGSGCKISHLAYVGDAELGENVNVGCGAVFVNYNGKIKQRTIVGRGSFIGSNCNLIAPVVLGERSFVAAGTTLTCNLNEDDFCIGRSRETVKPNTARKYLD